MTDLRWLSLEEVLTIHERQLGRFGGLPGTRDHGILESALSRPINKRDYENAGLAELAAAYAYGLARNHPFIDGNKRVAFLSMVTFLRLNDVHFAPPQNTATAVILELAAGKISEAGLVQWIKDNMPTA